LLELDRNRARVRREARFDDFVRRFEETVNRRYDDAKVANDQRNRVLEKGRQGFLKTADLDDDNGMSQTDDSSHDARGEDGDETPAKSLVHDMSKIPSWGEDEEDVCHSVGDDLSDGHLFTKSALGNESILPTRLVLTDPEDLSEEDRPDDTEEKGDANEQFLHGRCGSDADDREEDGEARRPDNRVEELA